MAAPPTIVSKSCTTVSGAMLHAQTPVNIYVNVCTRSKFTFLQCYRTKKTFLPLLFSAITSTGSNCELFNGQCTIQTGFAITIDTSCKAASYSQLPSNNNGLYAYPYQQNEAVTDILPTLPNNCKFDGKLLS